MSNKQQIVRYKVGKTNFEILTRPGSVREFKAGKLGWNRVLSVDEIFTNSSKGDRASKSDLKEAFDSDDVNACAQIIVEKGELQLSSSERAEMAEKKKREVIHRIHKYYVDPKTQKPHPVTRIESVLEEVRFVVQHDSNVSDVVDDVVKKLVGKLTLRKTETEGTVFIPHAFVGSVHQALHKYCAVKGENYDGKGCHYSVTLVPGDVDALLGDLNRITKGDFQFECAGGEAASTEDEKIEEPRGRKKKRGRR
jgi:ribosome maturation protein SDO1